MKPSIGFERCSLGFVGITGISACNAALHADLGRGSQLSGFALAFLLVLHVSKAEETYENTMEQDSMRPIALYAFCRNRYTWEVKSFLRNAGYSSAPKPQHLFNIFFTFWALTAISGCHSSYGCSLHLFANYFSAILANCAHAPLDS